MPTYRLIGSNSDSLFNKNMHNYIPLETKTCIHIISIYNIFYNLCLTPGDHVSPRPNCISFCEQTAVDNGKTYFLIV